MSFVTTKKMIQDAQKGGYAIGAFNVENMEMAQAVISAAEKMQSPVILQTTPSTLKYAKPETFHAIVKSLAEKALVPVALHLDHGNCLETAMQAFRAGYTSIMIDGSQGTLEENIAISKTVVDICHSSKIPVEAELSKVGGKEDDLNNGDDNPYTDPSQAAYIVSQTGVDFLAVAIGTAHGVYKGIPVLDKDRLSAIKKEVSIPLVLHGTSGVLEEDVQDCIARGICKVNYATDLRIAFSDGVKQYLLDNPNVYDPKKYNDAGRKKVAEYVMRKMEILGSAGKALIL